MNASIAALIYAMLALGFALVFLPGDPSDGRRGRGVVVWVAAAALLFFLDNPFVIFLFLFFTLLLAAPLQPAHRAAFFILVAPAFPLYVHEFLPFPGINFLTVLDYYKLCAFVLLLPLLFLARPPDQPASSWSASDFCVIAYVLCSAALVGAAMNLTSGLRFLLDQLLLVAAPYFAVTRFAARPMDIESCLKAFLTASIILAGIALVATFKQWDFYRLKEPPSLLAVPDFRGGFLRIGATANTHSLGFHLAVCVLLLEYFKSRLELGWMRLWALRGSCLVGLYHTGSRGAIASLLVMTGAYVFLSVRSSAVRVLLFVGMIGAAAAAAVWLLSGDAADADPYGTFEYRQRLLTTSLQYIANHLLFGDVNFARSGEFDSLVQGQGIIDITNLYLLVALNYGVLGFTLFFLPFAITLYQLAFRGQANRPDDFGRDQMRRILCAALSGWIVLVTTTSDVGLTLHLGLVLLALGRAVAQQLAPEPQLGGAGAANQYSAF
jgi:hypothetical protein